MASEQLATPTRGRVLLASGLVALTVLCVWKFIDYRMQPPPPPSGAVGVSR